ncbi:MAG: DUF2975 domain-containing protein [Oscillospiraceae bacterium]|nr:DUF2975 domain-containing protein [Oscillospiraceae bacterium]
MNSKIDSNRIGKIKVNALRIIVYLVMALTILLMCFMPRYIRSNSFFSSALGYVERSSVIIYMLLCCLPFLFALFVVKRICDLISLGNSFSVTTLSYLTQIVTCCYIEAIINVLALILFPILLNIGFVSLNLLIVGICGAVAVFTTVLKELVKSAIRLREENELTI